jgi:hypothetical protein
MRFGGQGWGRTEAGVTNSYQVYSGVGADNVIQSGKSTPAPLGLRLGRRPGYVKTNTSKRTG